MALLVSSLKTGVLKAMWNGEAQLKRFQKRPTLAVGLETIYVISWQRTWLLSVCVLRTCLGLN